MSDDEISVSAWLLKQDTGTGNLISTTFVWGKDLSMCIIVHY
jgi:hypothetical protein